MMKQFSILVFVCVLSVVFVSNAAAGSPAARVSDLTTGGCSVNLGSGNVVINGLGAARLGDPLVCPGGGYGHILQGSGTVMVNGWPASRVGDGVTQTLPEPPAIHWITVPGTIVLGSPNVLFGD
jgi:uncharacterized Zn-binding protein involved in type VI secretion